MECGEDTTDLLLETIRKELMSIIDNDGSEIVLEESKNKEVKSPQTSLTPPISLSQHDGKSDVRQQSNCKTLKNLEWSTAADNGISSRRSVLLDTHAANNIDEDLQSLRLNLNESYELFQRVGDRFENINFGCLKSRIKDLHLNERSSESIKTIVQDLKNSFDEKYMENRLDDLTVEVTKKFRKHPGEFGDIPELSEFFKTCTQLQHGLDKLKKQRNDVQDLTKRMTRVAELSYDLVDEIQHKIKK